MQCLRLLLCPVCQIHLDKVGNTLKCANAHTFDIAKEGYVNLLLKKVPGDTKEMLLARRDFLEQGYYQPLSDTINQLVVAYLRGEELRNDSLPYLAILDAGCGEGYYLGRLHRSIAEEFPHAQGCYIGLDISRDAERMAARKYKQVDFVVANLKERLVFASGALHVLLNIFAPRNVEEFARVVMPGGIIVVAIPSPTHLAELRAALHLLSIEEHKQEHITVQFADAFDLIDNTSLSYKMRLNTAEIIQVVKMTPNYWHMSDETRKAMEGMHEVETEAAFTCLVFQRKLSM